MKSETVEKEEYASNALAQRAPGGGIGTQSRQQNGLLRAVLNSRQVGTDGFPQPLPKRPICWYGIERAFGLI